MPRRPRSGNHSNNSGNQRRNGSKRKGNHTKAKERAKADNLQFEPSKWESQKYVIHGHLATSLICTAIISKEPASHILLQPTQNRCQHPMPLRPPAEPPAALVEPPTPALAIDLV